MSDIIVSVLVQGLVLAPLALMSAALWRRRGGGCAIAVGVVYLLLILLVWLPTGILTPSESLILPEENMRLVEKRVGLVRLQHAMQTNMDSIDIAGIFRPGHCSRSDFPDKKAFCLGISRFRMGTLSYFSQNIPPEKDTNMVRWSDHFTFGIEPDRAAHHAHIWHGRLYLWGIVAAANLLILAGVRLCGGRLRSMAAATLVLLALTFFWGYDHNYFNRHYGPAPTLSNITSQCDKSQIDAMLPTTRIIAAASPDNVWRREILIGGKDFFSRPFLSCKTGVFSYWYYFPATVAPQYFFPSFAHVESAGDGFYLVRYPDFTANFYLSLAGWLGCLLFTFLAAVMLLRRRTTLEAAEK